MSGYIGNIPVPQATQTRDTFTATAGQTTFATSGYTPSFLDVFMNGVHLVNGTDYTATNGSDVVLTSGAAAGDTLEVVAYSTYQVNSQNYTGGLTVDNDGATALTVDRATSDGTIIDLQKDGSSVGSMGSKIGNPYLSNSTNGGIHLGNEYGRVLLEPCNESGTPEDNLHFIGSSTNRWRDLYLSGGVYLGGTGAANYLDDYEEGTWTPVLKQGTTNPTASFSTNYGKYAKVGNLVFASYDLTVTSISGGSGYCFIDGLPFTAGSTVTMGGYSVPQYRASTLIPAGPSTTQLKGYVAGTGIIFEYDNSGTSGFGAAGFINSYNSSGRLTGYIIYNSNP